MKFSINYVEKNTLVLYVLLKGSFFLFYSYNYSKLGCHFFFGYGTFTETAVKAKMIPLTCTWQGFFFLWGLVFRVRQLLFFLSFGNRTVLKKFAIHQKYTRKMKFSKTHSKRAPPPFQVSGADGEVSAKGFVFLMFFPIATAHVLRAAGSSCMVHVYL